MIGVEPELAADARDSLHEGQQVAWPPEFTQQTIADALRVDQVGALPLQHMLEYVDDIVTVTEDEIRAAVRRLALDARLIAEPGGAVAVAACLFRRKELPSAGTTVAVLSGGNIDPGMLLDILAGRPVRRAGERRVGWTRYAFHPRLHHGPDPAVRRRHRPCCTWPVPRSVLLLGAALLVSGIVSYVVLSRQRDAMSSAITSRIHSFRGRLDAGSRAEDDD